MDAKYVVIDDQQVISGLEYADACDLAKQIAKEGKTARVKSERQHALDTNASLSVDLSGLTSKTKVELPVCKGAQAAAAALAAFNSKPADRRSMIVSAIETILKAEKSLFFRADDSGVVRAKLSIVSSALEWAVSAKLIELDWVDFSGNDQAGLTPGRQRMLVQWVAFFAAQGRLPKDNGELAI
jgi:hypothetical protein